MISPLYRCIFVHQRKSAGTSVKAMFEDDPHLDRGRFNGGVLDPGWRRDAPPVSDHYKFTVIRNPWDRFVSGWRYCRSTRDRSLIDVIENLPRPNLMANVLAREASLPARLAYGRAILRDAVGRGKRTLRATVGVASRAPQLPGHDYRHVTRQQVATVVYPDATLALDRVVFFEDLDAGLRAAFRDIGKPYVPPPALRVRRVGDDYRRLFDARARDAFDAAFRDDIDYWGYDFDTGLPSWSEDRGGRPAPPPSDGSWLA
jgi:hypothetical protein